MNVYVLAGLVAIATCMLAETLVSRRHERALLRDGAVEPQGDVYRLMRVAYPGSFAVLAAEGWYRGMPATGWVVAGTLVFLAAKALKYAAIAELGTRWTFKVLVLPGTPLVRSGPYRWTEHPNYIAVMAELAGAACYFGAALTGIVVSAGFGWLIARRLRVERAALRAAVARPDR